MYTRILMPLENSGYDRAIIDHVCALAKLCAAEVIVMHVADGWAARNQHQLALRESEEMREDRLYVEGVCKELCDAGVQSECLLAGGDAGKEISDAAQREACDLIAMAVHGHGFIQDVLRGSVSNEVKHRSKIPVLLVRGERRSQARATGEPPSLA